MGNAFAAAVLVCASSAALAAEGRTPIYAPGTLITNSGKYVVTRNLLGTGTPVIQINTAYADIDLNGFFIDGGGVAAIQILGAVEVRIHDGVMQGCSVGVDFVSGGVHRAILEDLRVQQPTIAGIRIDAVNNVAIRRVYVNQAADGIRINGGSPLTGRIEDCQLAGGAGRGISISGGQSLVLTGNTVSVFNGEGIVLDGCTGCLVKENTVTQAGGAGGIYVVNSRGVTLARNVASTNKSHGIHLAVSSRDTLVQDNMLKENGSVPSPADGLLVDGSTAMIVGNVMSENFGMGLHFTSASSGNTYGRNTARMNTGLAGGSCTGTPTLFFPNSCNESTAANPNTTFGDNLIPGPPLF